MLTPRGSQCIDEPPPSPISAEKRQSSVAGERKEVGVAELVKVTNLLSLLLDAI